MSNYQSLFVQTRDQPHADLLKEVFERQAGPKPNTWSRYWHIVGMRYCFYIGLYQALLIDGEMEKREKTSIDFMCVGPGASNSCFTRPY